ncbi:MAG: PSD1 and planctomycete cytochrome C domain-containing protein [Chthoniobacteraceae bacterium]
MRQLTLTLLIITTAALAAPVPTPDQIEFFEKKVRPILAEQCYSCHGPDKQKAELRVDSLSALLKGSDLGPVLIPGKPGESSLIQSIKHIGDAAKMPERKPKMPAADIEALEQWVAMGAPWPKTEKPATPGALELAKQHWSYQPVKKVTPPGAGNAIDSFISTELKKSGLALSPKADKRTLIRRATFDLIGLPPTAEEVTAFENDKSPDAFAKVVDRLLASPHYGERWARHWLDVARYADTKGYLAGGEERRYPFAYTYRDWVIRAFNEDLPYDKFITLQLAADKLVAADHPDLAAMGFLLVGRRFLNNINDIIDDRIDVISRGLMGITVACARCHDHKFDPLSQKDYYALHGILASSEEPADLPQIGKAVADAEAAAKYETELAKREGELDAFLAKKAADYSLLASVATGTPVALAALDRQTLRRVMLRKDTEQATKLDVKISALYTTAGAPPRAMILRDRPQPVQPYIFVRGNPGRRGENVPRQFVSILSGEKPQPYKDGSGRLELAKSITDPANPLTARVIANRVWTYHFGKGLVRTPGDFGVKGDPPTHPELLDWLATRFMDDGWSLKKLHRLILLTDVWQQTSDTREDAALKDPENLLLWRQNRQRLDFEAMRDSLLAASGQLDEKMFGQPVDLTNPPYATRRAVYGLIDRQNLPGVFRNFDFASPDVSTPQRFVTTVPQQALFLMNHPFVVDQARALAKEVKDQKDASEWQVQSLYERVLARRAEPAELDAAVRFLTADATRTPEPEPPPTWQYGYGFFDAEAKRVTFTPLPRFISNVWQGGAKLPDPKTGWALLRGDSGHAGSDGRRATIRRWNAPMSGSVEIVNGIRRPDPNGDGVEAIIVHSRLGVLKRATVAPKAAADMRVAKVEVQPGDTIDFIVDPRADSNSDSFTWAPVIRGTGSEWSAQKQFAGPPPPKPAPLTAWEKFAQVLFETNEFVFVD